MKMESEIESEITQPCPTLRNPMDCSLSGSSIHGILLARVLEWMAISFSLDGAYSQAMELKLGLKGRGCQWAKMNKDSFP